MKKLMAVIIIPYLVIVGITFYIFFGPGIFSRFEILEWKDIQIQVPGNYKVKSYENQGWEVYSLQKVFEYIRISRKSPAVDVSGFPRHKYAGKVIFQYSPGPGSIYYISSVRKTHEAVFAVNIDDATLYFSVGNASVFSVTHLLDKMLNNCFYKGQKIDAPKPSIPSSAYLTDYIFIGGMTVPIIIILLIFPLSVKRPQSKYFARDPIRLEESGVYLSRGRGYRRKNMFCYLVLTTSRLMIFTFGKPVLEIRLHEEKPEIRFEGKKMIIQQPNEKLVLRPADIQEWKDALTSYMY